VARKNLRLPHLGLLHIGTYYLPHTLGHDSIRNPQVRMDGAPMRKRRPRKIDVVFLTLIVIMAVISLKLTVDNHDLQKRLEAARITVIMPNGKVTQKELDGFSKP
jgi:hypothetical protein